MAELSGRVSALQMSLQLSAMREFELLGTGEDKPNPLLLERLRSCCLVIDVLGFKVSVPHPMHSVLCPSTLAIVSHLDCCCMCTAIFGCE